MTRLDIDEALHAADKRLAHGSTNGVYLRVARSTVIQTFRRYVTLARIQNLQSAFRYEIAQYMIRRELSTARTQCCSTNLLLQYADYLVYLAVYSPIKPGDLNSHFP